MSDAELADFAAHGGRWDWQEAVEEASFPGVARSFALLRELDERTRDLPADAVVRRVLDETLLLPLNAVAFEGAQRVANLRKLADSAGELARDGRLSLEEVVEALREGRVTEIESDAPLADDTVDAVRLSTIHRMKGLESGWVFLPDLARGRAAGASDRILARSVRGPTGERLALRIDGTSSSAAVWWERENARHEAAEETRVLYVALTRARNRLIVIAGPSDRGAPWLEALRPWGFDPQAPPADGELLCGGLVRHRAMAAPRPGVGRARKVRAPARRAAKHEYSRAFAALVESSGKPLIGAPSRLEADAGPQPHRGAEPIAGAPRPGIGLAVGRVVHRWLEQWRDTHSPSATETSLDRLCRAVAGSLGVDRTVLEPAVRSIVEGFLHSALARRLSEAEVLGRELPVLLRLESGETLQGAVDLLYRDAAGRIVVADFKTDAESDESRLREAYGRQLAAYTEAVRQALDLPCSPRAEIWMLRGGKIVTLSDVG